MTACGRHTWGYEQFGVRAIIRCMRSSLALLLAPLIATAQPLAPHQRLAYDIYKELVEINTVTATGDTAKAAEAMAARLRAAGFPADDVRVFTPAPRKGNMVARLHGTGAKKPILLLAHIDVVEAKREDWTTDPQWRADLGEELCRLQPRGEEFRRPQLGAAQGQCHLPSRRGPGAAGQIRFSGEAERHDARLVRARRAIRGAADRRRHESA